MSVFHTLRRASQIADGIIENAMRHVGLSRGQFLMLDELNRAAHPIKQGDLVASTGIDRSTVSNITLRLVGRGLVTRVRRKDDARAYDVQITPAGKDALAKVRTRLPLAEEALLARVDGVARLAIVELEAAE